MHYGVSGAYWCDRSQNVSKLCNTDWMCVRRGCVDTGCKNWDEVPAHFNCQLGSSCSHSIQVIISNIIGDRAGTKLSAGQPSFIVQEEFDRYSGYWWQPNVKGIIIMFLLLHGSCYATQFLIDSEVYRILFEEVRSLILQAL